MAAESQAQGSLDPEAAPEPNNRLTVYIVLGIVVALALAVFTPRLAASLHLGGEIFLRLLKMVVVPLVVASVMTGILGLGDVRKLGRPGGYTLLYYLSTTVLAVIVGLILVNIIRPGRAYDTEGIETPTAAEATLREHLARQTGLDEDAVAKALPSLEKGLGEEEPGMRTILTGLLLMLFTDNLFGAALGMDLLPLILFSIVFAGVLTTMGERVGTITRMIAQLNEALMSFVMLLMKFAPVGILCLVAGRFGRAQVEGRFLQDLASTGWYVAAVLIGLAIHVGITLPTIYAIFTHRNPLRFLLNMSQALLTAFSTASSSATLPVTIQSATRRAGVSRRSCEFVLPLGATINMDGTALYEAVAAIFIAQVVGMDLSLGQQLIIAVTATMAAIGAAGIPEAGLVTMIIVLNAVGLPIEYISIILAVDWFLDRFRTAVNVAGDSVGAAVVAGTFPPE